MPSFANSRAQLELMPGPPPTIRATSGEEVWASVSVMGWIPSVDACIGCDGEEARGLVRSVRTLPTAVAVVTRSGVTRSGGTASSGFATSGCR